MRVRKAQGTGEITRTASRTESDIMCIKQLLIIVRSYSKLQWQQKRLESGWIVSLFDNIQYKVRNVNMVSSFLCLLWHVGLRERKTEHRSCLV
jgi:hypothetical protein